MIPSHTLLTSRLSLLMFLQFFVWGAWFVTLGNYMMSAELGNSIGTAYSLGPIAAILSPFLLGMVVDRFFPAEKTLGVLHLLGGIAIFCAPFAAETSASLFILLLFVHTLFYMPTLGLSNALAFHHVRNPEREFPAIRVFGTIGWIVAGVWVSMILKADHSATPLRVAGIASVVLGLYCFSLPHTPPQGKGQQISVRDILGLDALRLLRERSMFVFFLCSFLTCIPLAAYYAFAPVFVNDAGFTNPAFKMSLGQASEIVFMLAMPLLFARLGVKRMLQIGMLAWVARYAMFAAGVEESLRWMVLVGIALHGICYDFFFVAGQIYVDNASEPRFRGQLQGLLVMVTQGFGMLIGAQIAGLLNVAMVQSANEAVLSAWKQYWLIPCFAAAVFLVIFSVLFRAPTAVKSVESASN